MSPPGTVTDRLYIERKAVRVRPWLRPCVELCPRPTAGHMQS